MRRRRREEGTSVFCLRRICEEYLCCFESASVYVRQREGGAYTHKNNEGIAHALKKAQRKVWVHRVLSPWAPSCICSDRSPRASILSLFVGWWVDLFHSHTHLLHVALCSRPLLFLYLCLQFLFMHAYHHHHITLAFTLILLAPLLHTHTQQRLHTTTAHHIFTFDFRLQLQHD